LKVAFISTLYKPNEIGGAERAVRVLAEALVVRGHEAVVISLDPAGKASKRVIDGVTVYYVPLANIHWPHLPIEQRPPWRSAIWHLIDAYNPVMGGRVRAILAAEKPDVVETNNLQGFSVAVWRAAQRLGIPVVQVLHDYYLGCPNSSMFRKGKNCATQCGVCTVYSTPRRLLSHIPQSVSSVSRRTLQRLEQAGMFALVPHKEIVPSAFDANHEALPRSDKPPGSHLTIGFLGRIEQSKGIEVLLRAVRGMPSESVTLLIAGNGAQHYVDELKRSYSRANIQFLGFTDPATFFARVDALVVPSIWEDPLPRVIFEGFAYGVPPMVSRIGGMPEIVEHGVTGYVFEPDNPRALTRLLGELVAQGLPSGRMGAACQEKSRGFSVDDVLRAHMSSWQDVIANVQRAAPVNATG
jgi:glycosyltransferase involved in cell wall biosynthesis